MAALVLDSALSTALAARTGVLRRGTPESVHALRTRLLRVQVWLALGRWHSLRDDVRWLRQSAAAVREFDVEAGLGVRRATGAGARAKALARLRQRLRSERANGLFAALAVLPALSTEAAQRMTRHWVRALTETTPDWSDATELHRLRQRARRLRYAMEWQGRAVPELKELQRSLGVAHDCWLAVHGKGRGGAERSRLKTKLARATARGQRAWAALGPAFRAERRARVRAQPRGRTAGRPATRRRMNETR